MTTLLATTLLVGTVGGCSDANNGLGDAGDLGAGVDLLGVEDAADAGDQDEGFVPTGLCSGQPDGTTCDDLDPCTLDDVCDSGVCVGGRNKVCDGQGPCQPGTCNPISGTCEYSVEPDGTSCNITCFTTAVCESGACKATSGEIPCPSPDNPCVDELRCNASTGVCDIEVNKLEGEFCNTDDNVCTVESCDADGACIAGELETCESESVENPCWTFNCIPSQGCTIGTFLEGNSCNDGNPCTSTDKCTVDDPTKKLCKGTPVNTDDLNPCTDDACVGGVISHVVIIGQVCPLGDENPCGTTGVCTDAGICLPANGCECDIDSDCPVPDNLCVGPLVCDKSASVPKCAPDPANEISCPIASDQCKQQLCEPATGNCFEMDAPDGTLCDDANACTLGDACAAGVCSGPQPVVCDDGVYCNGTEVCDQVTGCGSGTAPALDDGIVCTLDVCDEGLDAVTHTPDHASCGDGDVCNGIETCDVALGSCTGGTPPAIDDGVDCTVDACDPVNGVSHVIDQAFCGDGDVCNGGESCDPAQGGCIATAPPTVDDGIACTVDSCDPVAGVLHVPDNSQCEDDDVCNGIMVCDTSAGCILSVPAPPLSDGIGCTDDVCDPGNGVTHTPNDAVCGNSNVCDGAEYCDIGSGGCVSGTALVIDDGISCTADACDPLTGVSHTPNDAACTDNDACTGTETCVVGSGCHPGTPVVCSDGLYCNGEETCDTGSGACGSGPAPPVDDGVSCTIDFCDEDGDAIVHTVNCPSGQTCDPVLGCIGGGSCTDPVTQGAWFANHSYPGSGPVGVNQFLPVESVATKFKQAELTFPLTITHVRIYTDATHTYTFEFKTGDSEPGATVANSTVVFAGTGGFDVHVLPTPVTFTAPTTFWGVLSGTTQLWTAYGDGNGEATENYVESCPSLDGNTCFILPPSWSTLDSLNAPFTGIDDLLISIGTCQ